MNQHNSYQLATITKSFVVALLLSQSVISHTETKNNSNIQFQAFGAAGTGLACILGFSAFILELKNPQLELPTLDPDASLLEKVYYYIDVVVGQKRKTRFNEDGTVSKCHSRGLGVPYEIFKLSLPAIAFFQTVGKAQASLADFAQNIGVYTLIWPDDETID